MTDARGETSPNYGDGIVCGDTSSGTRQLTLIDVVVRQNVHFGIRARGCLLTVRRSRIERNLYWGVETTDSTVVFEQNVVISNGGAASATSGGLLLDGGFATVTNNIIARNTKTGVAFYADPTPARVDFNTIIDNGTGIEGQTVDPMMSSVRNNAIARNTMMNLICQAADCLTTGSLIVGNDITALAFVSPDVAPYDYHVMDGSSALGVADPSSMLMFDIDGDARAATGADVGADERP